MYCPSCGAEYRPGFTRCSDCGIDLVNELPVNPAPGGFDPHEVPRLIMVYRSTSHDTELMRGLLESDEIPCVVSGEGAAAAYAQTVGPLGERRILVREDDVERARELIARAASGALQIDETFEED